MPIKFSRQAQQAFSLQFKRRIVQVYGLFPELHDKAIVCGLIKNHNGRIEGAATGWTSPPVFRLRPNVSSYTIMHELTHILQGNGFGIPNGEVSCDIWSLNRAPAELLDERPHYLLKNLGCDWNRNKLAIKELCRQAIEIRKTRRTYIVWLRAQIKGLNSSYRI